MKEPTCHCGQKCYKSYHNTETDWLYEKKLNEPCWSFNNELNVWADLDYYVHYCDGHGHPEDGLPYVTRTNNETL